MQLRVLGHLLRNAPATKSEPRVKKTNYVLLPDILLSSYSGEGLGLYAVSTISVNHAVLPYALL